MSKLSYCLKIMHVLIALCLWGFIILFLMPQSCDRQIQSDQAANKIARDYAIIHKYN